MSEVRERVVSPGGEDPIVAGLAQVIGGPRGEHAVAETPARGGRVWTAARIVLALTCLTLMLHWVQKGPCRDGAWTDHRQYTNFCYTDVLALYYAEGLNQGKIPYVPEDPPDDHQVEYPVLTGAFMGLIGLPIHALGENNPGMNQGQWFYDINALVLFAFAVATVAMILSLRRRRPWDAALFALSPALLVTATVNWDFLAIVLAMAGLWLWARKQPLAAGVLLGLGCAAKLWPIFLLGPLLALAVRKREYQGFAWATGGAIGAWLVVNVPVMLLSMHDWRKFLDLNQTRAIDWGTFWYIGRYFDNEIFRGIAPNFWGDIPVITNLALILFGLGCVGVFWLTQRAPVPPRVAQLAFIVIALFLVTSKVWSQQFNLWLLPLLVLARPKWGAFLLWQAAEVGYFLAFYGELLGASGKPVIPEGTFVFASILRLATVIMLIVLVAREVMHPELDVVRTTYRRDPDSPPEPGDVSTAAAVSAASRESSLGYTAAYSVKRMASGLSSRFRPNSAPLPTKAPS